MRAVRFRDPSGDVKLGRLDGEVIFDAGPAGPRGFVPSEEGWRTIADASGLAHPIEDVRLLHPTEPVKLLAIGLNYRDHAEEAELEIPDVPVVFAKWTTCLIGHRQTIVVPREETRPDYEGEVAVVLGRDVYRADDARGAGGGGRDHGLPRRVRAAGAAGDAAAAVHAGQELRHVRADGAVRRGRGRRPGRHRRLERR